MVWLVRLPLLGLTLLLLRMWLECLDVEGFPTSVKIAFFAGVVIFGLGLLATF